MADLPADVITDILSRLPVTSLLQFRSTSKSWRSLIDSDHFKTLHFNKLHKLNSNLIILHNLSEFYAVDLPTLGNAVNLKQPLKSYGNVITIIGSCNGLLCIKNVKDDIAIWNPSLRKHWILPYPSTSCRCFGSCFYGFGFDSFTVDYKLVKISYFLGVASTIESKVNLFSCKSNAWKTLPNMPYALSWWYGKKCVFVDHALHWIAKNNFLQVNPKSIVAFDFRFEVFTEVPLPELDECFIIEVLHLGGCLSMVVHNSQLTGIDIWVMKQYGCKDSWFKLFTLMKSLELRSLDFVKPLGNYNDAMKVLFKQDLNKLFWYNLKSKQVSCITNPEMPLFDEAIIWVESFVQPPFPSENYKKQQKQQALECKNNTSKRMCLRS